MISKKEEEIRISGGKQEDYKKWIRNYGEFLEYVKQIKLD